MRRCSVLHQCSSHQVNVNKTIRRYHFTTTRMAIKICIFLRWKRTSVLDDVEKLESSCITGRNVKWWSHYAEQFPDLQKIQELPHDSAISFLVLYPRELHTHVHTRSWTLNVHNNLILNSLQVEPTKMFMNWWMDKQNGLDPYSGIAIHWNVLIHATAWKNLENVKCKKPDILCDSMCMKCPESTNP